MHGKGKAFGKGGLGCLAAFAVFAVVCLLFFGGIVHIDLGGAVTSFVIGGVIGLWIYQRGRRDGDSS